MENIKEFYVLGIPIETNLGKINFIKVEDYPELVKFSAYLNIDKEDLIIHLNNYQEKLNFNIRETFQNMSYVDMIRALADVVEIHQMLKAFFIYLFKEDVFDLITTDEEYDEYRDLIREMNCIHVEKKNPNPEIEYYNQLKRLYKKKKGGDELTFESMYTSVWFALGHEPKELTIYQLYAMFHRIAQFQTYHTTTLFSTVAEKVKIEPWYKHINVNREEEKVTLEDFSDTAKQLFGNNNNIL